MRGIKVLAMVMMLAAGMQAFAQNNTKRADKADMCFSVHLVL